MVCDEHLNGSVIMSFLYVHLDKSALFSKSSFPACWFVGLVIHMSLIERKERMGRISFDSCLTHLLKRTGASFPL